MSQQDYHCEITANVNAKEAFESISKGIPEWWTPNFEGGSQNVDDLFTIRFPTTFVDFEVTEIVPARKIVWQVNDCYFAWLKDKTEWTDPRVVWEFLPQNESTKISMTHIGLVPEIECYRNCVRGWDFFVKQSLRKLLTEGQGMPDAPRKERQEQ